MARLIESLSVTGSRKSDGTVNASGFVFLYDPGTTSRVFGYTSDDLSEAWTTTDGGIPLDAAGKADIWVNDPVDVVIQDSDGATVSTLDGFNKVRAEQVEVENDGYTGSLTDSAGAVTQALGGKTYLQTLLDRAYTSIGPNFQVKESAGATAVNVQDFLREVWISVTQFDADPTGNVDSTAAIQQAMDRVKALGGGVVYFPPGTYDISSSLSLSSANGVSIVGTGASVINQTGGTANVFTFTSCDDLRFQGIEIAHATSSTGSAFALTTCDRVSFAQINCGNISNGGDYKFCLSATSCIDLTIVGSTFATEGAGATSRGFVLTGVTRLAMFGGQVYSALGAAVDLGASTEQVSFHGTLLSSTVNFLANVGNGFLFAGCPSTSFAVAAATIPDIYVVGGDPQGSTTSSATGAAQTPSLIGGAEVTLIAASGGAGTVTVNSPAVLPGTTSGVDDNLYWDFVFKNAASGAVTWTLNAVFVVASAIPTTDAHTISVRFRWDITTSKLREVSRADTVT
jgi:hypothetical protein